MSMGSFEFEIGSPSGVSSVFVASYFSFPSGVKGGALKSSCKRFWLSAHAPDRSCALNGRFAVFARASALSFTVLHSGQVLQLGSWGSCENANEQKYRTVANAVVETKTDLCICVLVFLWCSDLLFY